MSCEKLNKKFEYYKNIRKEKKLFGTFGFREVVTTETVNKVKRIGTALALYIGKGRTIAIGKDPRISSNDLENSLIEGITQNGCNVLVLGITTPNSLSIEVNNRADAGVMITASHNPAEYNGMKCIDKFGRGFSPDEDLELEKIYFEYKNPITISQNKKVPINGQIFFDYGVNTRYCDYMISYIKKFPDFPNNHSQHMKIVVDGGGGSASTITSNILKRLGCEIVEFNCKYDGLFKERKPEPTDANLEKLKELVVTEDAIMGIAHDGDGDRTAFVDDKGKFVQGDVSASIITDNLLQSILSQSQKQNNNIKIAVTIAFSRIIQDIAESLSTEIIYTPVGEPYLAQAKLLCDTKLGLEEHGSIMLEWGREGPILAGFMAKILQKEDKSLSELISTYPKYFQIKNAIIIPENIDFDNFIKILIKEIPHDYDKITTIDGIRVDYPDKWFILRKSGTESKIRIFSEGKTEESAKRLDNLLLNLIKKIFSDLSVYNKY